MGDVGEPAPSDASEVESQRPSETLAALTRALEITLAPMEISEEEAPTESSEQQAPAESSEDEATTESLEDEASAESSEDEAPTESLEDEASEDEASAESSEDESSEEEASTEASEDEQATPESGMDSAEDNSKPTEQNFRFYTGRQGTRFGKTYRELEQGWVGVGSPNECLPLSQPRHPTRAYFEKASQEVTRKIGRSPRR